MKSRCENVKNIFSKNIFRLLFWPVVILMLIHFIEYGSLSGIALWIKHGFTSVIFSYLLIFLGILFVSAVFNSTFIGTLVVSLFLLIIALISYIKYCVIGNMIGLADFNLIKFIKEIALFTEPKVFVDIVTILNILLVILILALYILFEKNKKIKFNKIARILLIIFIPLVSCIFILSPVACKVLSTALGRNELTFSDHKTKGMIASLYLDYAAENADKYELKKQYNKEKIFSILDNVQVNQTSSMTQKPNVIAIMSESFMDVTKLPNLTFSSDPLPTIRFLMENYTSGNAVTGSYGSGTANVEFELLTGNSLKFMPSGSIAYFTDIFDREIYSLPKEFKKLGYSTMGIHSYIGEFYKRDIVYPKLGFDSFYAEESFKETPRVGEYVSDEYFVEQIIEKYNETSEPKFIFAVSMQNHVPYSISNYKKELYPKIESNQLSEYNLNLLQAYVNGISDMDKSIKKLIDYLEKREEPTIVLFFGDHWPALTDVFHELGYLDSDESFLRGEELYKITTIPFFIYNNFEHYSQNEKINNISLNKLGSFLLDYAGIKKSIYFNFIDNLTFRILYDKIFIDSKNNIDSYPSCEYYEEIENYKMLQYDILYGNQYVREYEERYYNERSEINE